MKKFGDTIRELRIAQGLGLRESAGKLGISPAYLSRIERGKETPPKSDIIKKLALILAADPDVLYRLASTTDPQITNYLNEKPELLELIRFINANNFSKETILNIIDYTKKLI